MNADVFNSLKLMGMGMGAIFFVIIIIFAAVYLMFKISNNINK